MITNIFWQQQVVHREAFTPTLYCFDTLSHVLTYVLLLCQNLHFLMLCHTILGFDTPSSNLTNSLRFWNTFSCFATLSWVLTNDELDILLHIFSYFCILLHVFCILFHIFAYFCTLLHIFVYFCALLHIFSAFSIPNLAAVMKPV